ncbi:hypothetical protein [Thermaurantiacus sp.]
MLLGASLLALAAVPASAQHAGQTVPLPVIGPGLPQGPFNDARQQTTGIDLDAALQPALQRGLGRERAP